MSGIDALLCRRAYTFATSHIICLSLSLSFAVVDLWASSFAIAPFLRVRVHYQNQYQSFVYDE